MWNAVQQTHQAFPGRQNSPRRIGPLGTVILRGSSVNSGTDGLGGRQTIINSIFIKVWVEGGVVIFRVGGAGVGWILGGSRMRALELNKGH